MRWLGNGGFRRCRCDVVRVMVTINVFPLAPSQPAMFMRQFDRASDADDYEAFWRRLGQCRIVRR